MDNILKEGEQMMDGGNNNNNQGQGQGQGNDSNQQYDRQSSNQGGNQQQSSGNSGGGGGFMKGMEQNTEDAYINNEANSLMTKEGVPSAVDGAIDGALDTEVNKYSKDL